MRDRLYESETFGLPLDLARYERPVVLAPHPDDEVIGCGGLLALWAAQGVEPLVVVLTSGQAQMGLGADAQMRVAESQASAQLLGLRVEAWNLEDRQIRCHDALIERVAQLIRATQTDVVLTPALSEPHPDHQATTLALCCAMARAARGQALPDVLLYESGAAMTHPNRLVDISSVAQVKARAMAAFGSQEAAQPYASRIAARDHFRGMTLGRHALAAEAFTLLQASERGWPAVVAGLEPLYLHGRGQAVGEQDLPLVSVLVRTVGDPHLERTLASVAAQTYARMEVVVVVANGAPQAEAGWPERVDAPIRWVHRGSALSRPQAANAALDAASGEWLIFLDDDDLWAPDHLEKLVRHRRSAVASAALHTDASVIDANGRELTRYDLPYSPQRLAFTNTFPIHTVMFERRLVTEVGCRFDETLPVLEDWDFWLQVTSHTDVAHVPGVSAFYRWADRSRLTAEDDRHHQRWWRDKVQTRWMARWPQDSVLAAIRWYTGRLDQVMQERESLAAQVAASNMRMQEEQAQLEDTRRELTLAGASLQRLEAERTDLHNREAAARALLQDTRTELALAGASLQRLEAERTDLQNREAAARALLQDTRTELALAGQSLARTFAEAQEVQRLVLAKDADMQALAREAEDLRRQLESVNRSISWRVTHPLRRLSALLRGGH